MCRRHGLGSATFYKLKSKYGGLEVSGAARLKALEDENAKLKRLLADTMLDNVVLKGLWEWRPPARHRFEGKAGPDDIDQTARRGAPGDAGS